MFKSTLSHSSFSNLNKTVIGKTGENVEALFSGTVEKTLLETPEVKVTINIPYGSKAQRPDPEEEDKGNFNVTYTTPTGKLKTRNFDFACDTADFVKTIYAQREEISA